MGISAAASTAFAGLIISTVGYSAAFLALGGVAFVGTVFFAFAMPETVEQSEATPAGPRSAESRIGRT